MRYALRRTDAAAPAIAVDGSAPSPALMAGVMAGLFATGGILSFSISVFPRPEEAYEPGYYAVGALALACALFLRLLQSRLPAGALPWFAAAGTLFVTLDIWFSPETHGGPASDIEILYLWGVLYSAYFFTRVQLAIQIACIGACYGFVLMVGAPSEMVATRWIQTVLTLGIAGFLLVALRDRLTQLVERLADAARTDPLTGLQNRRGFEERIEYEVERAGRGQRELAVVIGDLDEFKRFNDRHGHQTGDAALVRIGEMLQSRKRSVDSIARTGGEEFALVLPDTGNEGALLVAERLRAAVEREFDGQQVELTFSFGVATFPAHGDSADELLAAADQAMYAAKQLGRNRTVIFSDQIASIVAPAESGHTSSAEVHLATLLSLAEALDLRDTGTSEHSQTVGRYTAMTARELELSPARVRRIRIAGILHDIGKIGIPDDVLRKAGPLNEHEWVQMRRHPEIGAGILGSKDFEDVRSWVLAHHEQPDGRGYPLGLSGDDIPLEARILAVADAYEAMTADRVYRKSMGHEAARAELLRCAGSQFDEQVVRAFLTALDRAELRVMRPSADR
jgi:diguanylate cyclase (GGDEF)-like protein/putative nucleotidyltransferase with HDIG domain